NEVEIYFQPQKDKKQFVQFMINPNGLGHAILHTGNSKDVNWNPKWRYAAYRVNNGWGVEIFMPWASLFVHHKPNPGAKAYMDFFRNYVTSSGSIQTAWIPTNGPFAQPVKFGLVNFGK